MEDRWLELKQTTSGAVLSAPAPKKTKQKRPNLSTQYCRTKTAPNVYEQSAEVGEFNHLQMAGGHREVHLLSRGKGSETLHLPHLHSNSVQGVARPS